MKSWLFTTIFDDRESDGAKTFARHLDELVSLEEVARQVCLESLPNVRAALTERQTAKLVQDLAGFSSVAPQVIRHSLFVLSYLTDALLSEDCPAQDYEKWSDDLVELGWLKTESKATFESAITTLVSKLLPDLRFQTAERRARGGVLPAFNSLGITVEARPIRKGPYRWGKPVAEYTPQILGTTMIASIHIGVDEGNPKDLYFQADAQDIDNIVSSLIAAKKEMDAFRTYLRLDPLHEVEQDD